MNEEIKDMSQEEIPQETIPQAPRNDEPEKSSSGPIAGIAIIVILLIAGGVYFWSSVLNKEETEQLPMIQSGGEVDAIVNQLNLQGTSDEVADIEADLNTTDLGSLDSELEDLLDEL